MCSTVFWRGRRVELMGEARKLWGKAVHVLPGYGPMRDDYCLCPLDMDATAAALGCAAEPGWVGDPLAFSFTPLPRP